MQEKVVLIENPHNNYKGCAIILSFFCSIYKRFL